MLSSARLSWCGSSARLACRAHISSALMVALKLDSRSWCRAHISSALTVWLKRTTRVSCSHQLDSHGVALKRTTRAPGCRAPHQLGSHGVALSSARLALLGVVLSSARPCEWCHRADRAQLCFRGWVKAVLRFCAKVDAVRAMRRHSRAQNSLMRSCGRSVRCRLDRHGGAVITLTA